jgi:ubiquinone/menaquinone biosynthesis C-methylase UbiE
VAAALHDDGPVGNVYDKYATRNPVARWLMQGFLRSVSELYQKVGARSVLEVGCGEGLLAQYLITQGSRPDRFEACDLKLDHLAANLDPALRFREASIYELPWPDRSFELVVCCEVLEHLREPSRGLAELARVASRAILLSTPREPAWRMLNVARGKYWAALGNTPGHVQHFSRRALERFVSSAVDIEQVRTPVPWTVLLGTPRRASTPP